MSIETPRESVSRQICLRCFGRAFAKEGTGLTNLARGENFFPGNEEALSLHGLGIVEESNCAICKGAFSKLGDYYDVLSDEVKDIEFSTFLVGSTFPKEIFALEEELKNIFGDRGESIKKEFNREFGKLISLKTGKSAEFDEPDITINVNLQYDSFSIKLRSLYVHGIYRKDRRDIPQTRWIHKKGMEKSLETLIGDQLNALTGGKNYFLHGAGREDVDVRMLGNGREFIIESQDPKARRINLEELENRVNKSGEGIEIVDLRFSSKEEVVVLKGTNHDKTYRVLVGSSLPLDVEKIKNAAEKLTGKDIYQRTPLRVSTRRSDLIRKKQVREATVESTAGNEAVLTVRAEAGTYIKELVHGDEGRTTPSLSELYGSPLNVIELDVVWIHRNGELNG